MSDHHPDTGPSPFSQLRRLHGNPAAALVQHPVSGRTVGILGLLFDEPLRPSSPSRRPSESELSIFLALEWIEAEMPSDTVFMPVRMVIREHDDVWPWWLSELSAGRFEGDIGDEPFHLQWLQGAQRQWLFDDWLEKLPAGIRERLNDLG